MGRYTDREFRLGDCWVGQRDGSPAWYRCWREGRRTKRASLGTSDFDEAKQRLTDWFISQRAPVQEKPAEAFLADILRRYYDQHGKTLRSGSGTRTSINLWLDFWGPLTVADLTVPKQEEFHAFLREKGLKDSTVLRTLTVGKAALNRSYRRGEIQSVPYVLTVSEGPQEPMGRPMTVEELRALYSVAPPHMKVFMAWMLGTAARPEAILQLHSSQVDWEEGVVHLNPTGRKQTKKYRPSVRLLPSLAEMRFDGPLIVAKSKGAYSVRTAWRAGREEAGLDDRVNPYSLRHTSARWMRKQGVSEWDVETQMGHRRPGTTETYTAYDPAYLEKAAETLEKLVRASCAPLPVRQKFVAVRNRKEVQRDRWWAL